jgi:hypothetical protein
MRDPIKDQKRIQRRDFVAGMMLGALGKAFAGDVSPAQTEARVGNQEAGVEGAESPGGKMVPWMFVHGPLESYMAGYQRTFDAWEEGGIRGIVLGYMRFFSQITPFEMSYQWQYTGAQSPTFAFDPKIYAAFGVAPPREEPRDPAKEKMLHAMLDNAASRGWEIYFFGSGQAGGSLPLKEDPFDAVGFSAGVQDTMNAFPQAHGIIMDGALSEHSYELAFHHGGEVFEITDDEKSRLSACGIDVVRVERGAAHLFEQFHKLTPSRVRYYSPGGLLGALWLFDFNEDALYWLRMRQEGSLRHMEAVRGQIDRLNRKVKLGGITRISAFSLLTTQDYFRMSSCFDYVFPKLYFWNRGFDGMYGTISRWVQKIAEWNPKLSQRDCFEVVKAWFGLQLPGIHSVADMDLVGFPDEFFSEVVYSETQRALAGIGDDNKVIGWVSSGRHPHAGDPMSSKDLYRILTAAQRAGLKRFVYHPDFDLGAPEWEVISGLCGKRWKEEPQGKYWPTDTPQPDTWNGGRKPRLPE